MLKHWDIPLGYLPKINIFVDSHNSRCISIGRMGLNRMCMVPNSDRFLLGLIFSGGPIPDKKSKRTQLLYYRCFLLGTSFPNSFNFSRVYTLNHRDTQILNIAGVGKSEVSCMCTSNNSLYIPQALSRHKRPHALLSLASEAVKGIR